MKKVVLLLPLLQRALRSVGTSRAELITALRADPRLYPVDEGRAEDPKMALMFARPDIAVSESGPKVMEFNTGAGIGSYTEQHVMQEVWREVYGSRIPELDPLVKWAQVFARLTTRNGSRPSQLCALATRRDYPDEVLDFDKFFGIQAELLKSLNVEYIVCEPENLDACLDSLSPDTCVGVRHFHAFEWRAHDIDFSPLQRALDRGFAFYFPQEAAMLANKRILAWLSEKNCYLSPDESRLVDDLIPWTRELLTTVSGARDLYRYVLDCQDRLVLKRCMSLSSRDVVVGRLVAADRWRSVVEAAYVAGDSVVQEFVEHESAQIYVDVDGKVDFRKVYPVLSPFFVDGEYCGCQARYMLDGSVKPSSVDLNGAVMNTVAPG